MAKKKVIQEKEPTKSRMLTLRIDLEREEDVETARTVLNSQKPDGSKETTKSEAISILMSFGMKLFRERYAKEIDSLKFGAKKKSA